MAMPLTDFYRRRIEYEARARARFEERLNNGDDTTWPFRVTEEMLIDLIERTERLEAIFKPE
jgi:hypothetical protein